MSAKCNVCSKKFISTGHLRIHLKAAHDEDEIPVLRKGWVTPYGFVDFAQPVSYKDALEQAKEIHDRVNLKDNTNGESSTT